MKTIDCHTHIFPKPSAFLEKLKNHYPDSFKEHHGKIDLLTKALPEFRAAHNISQTAIRKSYHLPPMLQKASDKYLSASSFYSLLTHSSSDDLILEMHRLEVTHSVVIAHPPLTTNEMVLDFADSFKGKILPFVNVGICDNPVELLESYIARGAAGIKLHHASDGKAAGHPYYREILELAQKHQLPVIIHTGCFHIKPLHKCPEFSDVNQFKDYFDDFPKVRFILAHMNYRHPKACLELLKKYPMVMTDISWQTDATILEAFDCGLEDQLLFGSDWPIVGNNIEFMKNEVLKCGSQITPEQREKLMTLNAQKLFNLSEKD